MDHLDLSDIKKKSLRGVVALTSRTFVLQLIAFGATFLLTIFLAPSVFGVFYVVSAIISFLGYFSDVGLAAALIQKHEDLTRDDLVTTFTIQQLLVGTVSVIAFASAPAVVGFYGLSTDGLWLFRALIVSFVLSSLKTIPSILLERKLEFTKLIVPQLLETIGFYSVAVILAWRGYGITSFTWAVVTRAVLGLISLYIISPWRVEIGVSRTVARRLLRFGIPFQVNSMLALVKDDLLTVFLGKVLPFAEIGYIGWAKKWAEVPLRLIMDSVIRVTFPAFSRLQHSKNLIGSAINNTLFGLSVAIFPLSTALLFLMEPFVSIIPRYSKWEPALISFYLFVVGSALASLSTPLTNALNAVGKIRSTLLLMVLWTASTWILTTVFIQMVGFNGVSLALLIITSTLIVVVRMARSVATFEFIPNIQTPIIGCMVQATVYWFLLQVLPIHLISIVIIAVIGLLVYGLIVWQVEKSRITGLLGKLQS